MTAIKQFSSEAYFDPSFIRNFSIIAHVDHGKSTLADRLIEVGCNIQTSQPQILDNLQIERERGITVKAQTAALSYSYISSPYTLNLIDTPGHIDFSHEVCRSLSISDGVLLLVDATQGVQAQTVSNFYHAFERELDIIGVINKIDAPNADIDSCLKQMSKLFDLEEDDISFISAKTGENVAALFPKIIRHIRSPDCKVSEPTRALLHDCTTIPGTALTLLTVFVKSGKISTEDEIYFLSSGKEIEIKELGMFTPHREQRRFLSAGQVGYIIVKLKNIGDIVIRDTISTVGSIIAPLQPISQPNPTVFAGLFPDDDNDFESLNDAVERLCRNDTSVTVSPDSNVTLGKGWKLGFLGTLHMEVFTQRLDQEYNASAALTQPTIIYKADLKSGDTVEFNSADDMPLPCNVCSYYEPVTMTTIIVSDSYVSDIISKCMQCRGEQEELVMLDNHRYMLKYRIPLAEIMSDFYSSIKKMSRGYASCDFEEIGHQEVDVRKVDIIINGVIAHGLSAVVRSDVVREYSVRTVRHLATIIPRQLFSITIQCAVGGTITGRSNVKPLRKDVTKDLYGGDVSRAKKLLKRQADSKKKLRQVGKVHIPKEVYRIKLDKI